MESPNHTNLALRFDWLKHKEHRERGITDQMNIFEEMIGNDTFSNDQLVEYNDL